jgi:hypothetical protein
VTGLNVKARLDPGLHLGLLELANAFNYESDIPKMKGNCVHILNDQVIENQILKWINL